MNNPIIDKLADNEYYHGTASYKAIQILYEGFRLKKCHSKYGSGGTFKQGIYLTKSLSSAKYFGSEYIFKCHFKKGISIVFLTQTSSLRNICIFLFLKIAKTISRFLFYKRCNLDTCFPVTLINGLLSPMKIQETYVPQVWLDQKIRRISS